jgi:hypothetical protein
MFASKDLFFSKPSGYQISRSMRLRASATAYFNRTAGTATNQSIATWSFWLKRGTLGTTQIFFEGYTASTDAGTGQIGFTNDSLTINGFSTNWLISTQVFRDPSAWYHIVVAVDTTQATASNRIKCYVNGLQITSFSTASYPTQNSTLGLNNNSTALQIGRRRLVSNNDSFFDGYLTEVNFIDGQALTPSSFGQTNTVTGVWQPIKYTGTYGTNGFYLNFSDNSNNTATTIGKDYSGNGNNWTPNNISVTAGATYDSMLDVPTIWADGGNGRGNYCVINPLNKGSGTVSDGNLSEVIPAASGTAGKGAGGTIAVSSGKWYAELVGTVNSNFAVGVMGADNTTQDIFTSGVGYYSNGNKYVSGSVTAYGSTYTTNDVIGVALDIDGGTVTFYKNNTSQGAITLPSLPSGGWRFHVSNGTSLNTQTYVANFGQRPFTYTPPTGFVALNTQNLPTPTISNGAAYMAATTWTSNGSTQSISNAVNGMSFQPDFVWNKSRSGVGNHVLNDSVRGAANYLSSNTTSAEAAASTYLTSFDSGGFSLGTGNFFGNGTNVVGWQWNAGGSTVTNTSGSISAQVRANPTAGFSVVTYTGNGTNGATFGHGLGVAPSMVIGRCRSTTEDWPVYHVSLSAGNNLRLNSTSAQFTYSSTTSGGIASTSSTVVTTGQGVTINGSMNASGATYVAYCFAPVAGYSAFGKYTGNGSADGPFVFTNFQPRWVMVKRTDSTSDWYIWDTSRDTYNVETATLLADTSGAETSATSIDGLSNGFKCRSATVVNASGGTYIFAAFASSPFKNSLAR